MRKVSALALLMSWSIVRLLDLLVLMAWLLKFRSLSQVPAMKSLQVCLTLPDERVRGNSTQNSGAIVHPAHLDDDEAFSKLKQSLYASLAGEYESFVFAQYTKRRLQNKTATLAPTAETPLWRPSPASRRPKRPTEYPANTRARPGTTIWCRCLAG